MRENNGKEWVLSPRQHAMQDTHLFLFFLLGMENGKERAHVCCEDSLLCVQGHVWMSASSC